MQDYNSEVLHELTIPNLCLNFCNAAGHASGHASDMSKIIATLQDRTVFWAGDWAAGFPRSSRLADEGGVKFDVILCSDVLYTAQSTVKVLQFIKCNLKPHGSAYIGTKSFYFGCGGGVLELQELVDKDKTVQLESVAKFGESNDLQREILRLYFAPSQS